MYLHNCHLGQSVACYPLTPVVQVLVTDTRGQCKTSMTPPSVKKFTAKAFKEQGFSLYDNFVVGKLHN